MWRGLGVTAATSVPSVLCVVCSHSFLDRHLDLSNEARPLADKVNALIAIEFLPATHCGVIFYRVLCRRHVRRDIRRVLWCIISPLLPVSGFVFFLLAARCTVPCDVVLFSSSGPFCQTSPNACTFSDNSLLGVAFHTVDICSECIYHDPP